MAEDNKAEVAPMEPAGASVVIAQMMKCEIYAVIEWHSERERDAADFYNWKDAQRHAERKKALLELLVADAPAGSGGETHSNPSSAQ